MRSVSAKQQDPSGEYCGRWASCEITAQDGLVNYEQLIKYLVPRHLAISHFQAPL
jgi:hypothetical protein